VESAGRRTRKNSQQHGYHHDDEYGQGRWYLGQDYTAFWKNGCEAPVVTPEGDKGIFKPVLSEQVIVVKPWHQLNIANYVPDHEYEVIPVVPVVTPENGTQRFEGGWIVMPEHTSSLPFVDATSRGCEREEGPKTMSDNTSSKWTSPRTRHTPRWGFVAGQEGETTDSTVGVNTDSTVGVRDTSTKHNVAVTTKCSRNTTSTVGARGTANLIKNRNTVTVVVRDTTNLISIGRIAGNGSGNDDGRNTDVVITRQGDTSDEPYTKITTSRGEPTWLQWCESTTNEAGEVSSDHSIWKTLGLHVIEGIMRNSCQPSSVTPS
jgi:hypothetical protein